MEEVEMNRGCFAEYLPELTEKEPGYYSLFDIMEAFGEREAAKYPQVWMLTEAAASGFAYAMEKGDTELFKRATRNGSGIDILAKTDQALAYATWLSAEFSLYVIRKTIKAFRDGMGE